MPKSNSWFPSAAAVTPSALYTSVTLLPWKRFEISVPWKASPASRTMTAPPCSFACARTASRYPPNQSAPPISLSVLEAIHFGAATSSRAPCVSLMATIVSFCPSEGTAAFAGDGTQASAATRSGIRGRIADAIRCHNHLTRRIEVGTNCVLCPRIPSYAWDMRAGAAVSRAEDVRLAARDAATRALDAAGLDEAGCLVVAATPEHLDEALELCEALHDAAGPKAQIVGGATTAALVPGDAETEEGPALGVLALEHRAELFSFRSDAPEELRAAAQRAGPGALGLVFADPAAPLQRLLGALGKLRIAGGGVAVEGGLLLDHDLAYAHAVEIGRAHV